MKKFKRLTSVVACVLVALTFSIISVACNPVEDDGNTTGFDKITINYDYGYAGAGASVFFESHDQIKTTELKNLAEDLPKIKTEYSDYFACWTISASSENSVTFVANWNSLPSGIYDSAKKFIPWDELKNDSEKITLAQNKTMLWRTDYEAEGDEFFMVIDETITILWDEALYNCDTLFGVEFSSKVSIIPEDLFRNSPNVRTIKVNDENTTYDSRDNCNAVIKTETNELLVGCKSTIIPNDVVSLADRAFAYCTGLTRITIPKSVTTIGQYAFLSCSNLTEIIFEGSQEEWEEIDFTTGNTALTDGTITIVFQNK